MLYAKTAIIAGGAALTSLFGLAAYEFALSIIIKF